MGSFFDFLNPVFDAMAWVIVQFHAFFSLMFPSGSGWAWGLSIVLLVVVIRICLIPLFVKQIKTTRNMQLIQPELKKIQQKYKHDKQRQQQELMKLYKETGTNPFASCLPILIQSPFFLALFRVLSGLAGGTPHGPFKNNPSLVTSAQHAQIFGAPIATAFRDSANTITHFGGSPTTVKIVTVVMIVLMSASQFITQRQLVLKNTATDAAGSNPFARQQKLLMYVFPVMFAVFGINFPVGVLIYWLTTNVWSMGQQLVVIRRNPTPGSPAAKAREERLAAKMALRPADAELADGADGASDQAARHTQRQQPVRTTRSRRSGAASQPQRAARDTAAAESPEEEDAAPAKPAAPAKAATPSGRATSGKASTSSKAAPSSGATAASSAAASSRAGTPRTGAPAKPGARTKAAGQAKPGRTGGAGQSSKPGAQPRSSGRPKPAASQSSDSAPRGTGGADAANDAKPAANRKPGQRNQPKRNATRGGRSGGAEARDAAPKTDASDAAPKTGEVAGSAPKKGK